MAVASPEVIAKAVRLPVTPRGDGMTFSVAGDSGTWTVYRYGDGLRCSCPVGGGSQCSHRVSVQLYEERQTARTFDIDALTGEQIAAMTLVELGQTLNATMTTIIALAKERQTQNIRLADLRVRGARYKTMKDAVKLAAVQDEIIIQRAVVDNLRIRASAAKDLKSGLQSTIRAALGAGA